MDIKKTPHTYKLYKKNGYTIGGYPDDSVWYVRFQDCQKLEIAIRETIEDNLHLADGENCTLSKLKKVLENSR